MCSNYLYNYSAFWEKLIRGIEPQTRYYHVSTRYQRELAIFIYFFFLFIFVGNGPILYTRGPLPIMYVNRLMNDYLLNLGFDTMCCFIATTNRNFPHNPQSVLPIFFLNAYSAKYVCKSSGRMPRNLAKKGLISDPSHSIVFVCILVIG